MENINNKKRVMSHHGLQRVLERTNCKAKNADVLIEKVWKSGRTIESYDKKSKMFSYLTNVKLNGGKDREVRVKGNAVYIFNKIGSVLITCFNVPQGVLQNKNKKEWRSYNG